MSTNKTSHRALDFIVYNCAYVRVGILLYFTPPQKVSIQSFLCAFNAQRQTVKSLLITIYSAEAEACIWGVSGVPCLSVYFCVYDRLILA